MTKQPQKSSQTLESEKETEKKVKNKSGFLSGCSPDIIRTISSFLHKRDYEAFTCVSRKFKTILYRQRRVPLSSLQSQSVEKMLKIVQSHKNGKKGRKLVDIDRWNIKLSTGTGTGKTITALMLLDRLVKTGKKCLIVTKKILTNIWMDEWEKFSQDRNFNLEKPYIFKPPGGGNAKPEQFEKRKKDTLEQIKGKKLMVIPSSVFGYDITDYRSHSTVESYNVYVNNVISGRRYGYTRQTLLDIIYKLKWDVVVFDDCFSRNKSFRLRYFNPNMKIIKIDANLSRGKNIINNYQKDPELGSLPEVKTNIEYCLYHQGKENVIVKKIEKLVQESLKLDGRVVFATLGEKMRGRIFKGGYARDFRWGNVDSPLGTALKKIKNNSKYKDKVFFLGKNKSEDISKFCKFQKGIIVGSCISFARGHNIFPKRVIILNFLSYEDTARHRFSKVQNPTVYQLIGRMRRPGSPHKECHLKGLFILDSRNKKYVKKTSQLLSHINWRHLFENIFRDPDEIIKFAANYDRVIWKFLTNRESTSKIKYLHTSTTNTNRNNIKMFLEIVRKHPKKIEDLLYKMLTFFNLTPRNKNVIMLKSWGTNHTSTTRAQFETWLYRGVVTEEERDKKVGVVPKKRKYSEVELVSMKVVELLQICRDEGIKGYSGKRKIEVIKMILSVN